MIEKKDGVDELFSLKGSNVITPFFGNFTRVSNFFWFISIPFHAGL